MWRHHFPKQKNINLCEVLVLSDVRPSKNLTFCNVWARKPGSSLCNRVRLNFQVCALRDIEMSDWNSSFSRRSIDFDIWELWSNIISFQWQNSMTNVSVTLRPPCWCQSAWAPTWRPHSKLYKFGWNTLPNNARRNYRTDLNLGEVVYI